MSSRLFDGGRLTVSAFHGGRRGACLQLDGRCAQLTVDQVAELADVLDEWLEEHEEDAGESSEEDDDEEAE